jgi:hypothetical protein
MKKMGSTFLGAVLGTVVVLGLGSTAHALSTTIGGASCASCFGSVYTLSVVDSGTANLWNVTYSVDTTNYSGQGSGLDAIAFKITSNSSNILSTSITSQPSSFGSLTLGGLSAGGCGSGPAGFICSQSSNLGGVAVPNGTYTFQYGVTLAAGTLFGNVTDWSIKGLYVDSTGKQAGLTSEHGSVPVPGTSLLFGVGMALFAGWHRKFSRQV